MKRIVVAGILSLMCGSGQAWAQSCTGASTAGITAVNLEALVGGRYACVGSSPTASWNEKHTGSSSSTTGFVDDYKLGPSHAVDPSDGIGTGLSGHHTGSYRITSPGGAQQTAVITYTYGTSGFGYYVVANLAGTIPWASSSTYSFCGMSGGAPNLAVTISASPC